MFFRQVFDPSLAQYAYLIGCQRTGEAIVIDPASGWHYGGNDPRRDGLAKGPR